MDKSRRVVLPELLGGGISVGGRAESERASHGKELFPEKVYRRAGSSGKTSFPLLLALRQETRHLIAESQFGMPC